MRPFERDNNGIRTDVPGYNYILSHQDRETRKVVRDWLRVYGVDPTKPPPDPCQTVRPEPEPAGDYSNRFSRLTYQRTYWGEWARGPATIYEEER